MRYNIHNLIGEKCITSEDGQKVYDLVYPELIAGRSVELDFSGVKFFTPSFFNAFLNRLLINITSQNVGRFLKIFNMVSEGIDVLKRSIKIFKQPESDNVVIPEKELECPCCGGIVLLETRICGKCGIGIPCGAERLIRIPISYIKDKGDYMDVFFEIDPSCWGKDEPMQPSNVFYEEMEDGSIKRRIYK
ncbi:MAG: STAS-like domain-containing protein [Deltaproteobacteria bacterium]|nr:STAS-like domain-containing protein [Deltaproteobacteria bacterium]